MRENCAVVVPAVLESRLLSATLPETLNTYGVDTQPSQKIEHLRSPAPGL
uniref:Uncharacterized protein n=1 Tax=Arion vulgaris TaxID=1028688 RepID=A0A0B7BJG4_9EUPU